MLEGFSHESFFRSKDVYLKELCNQGNIVWQCFFHKIVTSGQPYPTYAILKVITKDVKTLDYEVSYTVYKKISLYKSHFIICFLALPSSFSAGTPTSRAVSVVRGCPVSSDDVSIMKVAQFLTVTSTFCYRCVCCWLTMCRTSLEKGRSVHCSVLTGKIPWTEEPTVHGVAKSWTRLSD